MVSYTYLILAILINFSHCQECALNPLWTSEVPIEVRLKTELLEGYSVTTPPKSNNTKGVEVAVDYIIQMLEFDVHEEQLTIYSWNTFEWEDDRLKWDLDKYKGITTTVINYFDIWAPGIMAKVHDNKMMYSDKYECAARNTGHVKCVMSTVNFVMCSSAVKDWPYDWKNCTFEIDDEDVWSLTKSNITFTEFNFVDFQETYAAWRLVYSKEHLDLPGDYQVFIEFVLERVAEGLEASIVVPAVVLSILTVISILLDVKNNARLGVLCVTLFSHFLFLIQIKEYVPREGTVAPNILLFISASMSLTLTVLVLTMPLRYLRSRKSLPPIFITSINTFVLNGYGQYLVFPRWNVTIANKTVLDSSRQHNEWLDFSNIINSIVFIFCVIRYIAMFSIYLSPNKFVIPH